MNIPRFKHILLLLLVLVTAVFLGTISTASAADIPIFINEIHYDNAGADVGEAIEVAGPAGTDLTGWSLVLYNGNNGASYNTTSLTGTIPDVCGGFGTVFSSISGIQNGAPDGIALVDASNIVVQFLSYEGSFTAVGGPANGLTSVDIGVSQTGSTLAGNSLQLGGTGTSYEDFTWESPAFSTFRACNTNQTFSNNGPTPTSTPVGPTPTSMPPTPTPPPITGIVINEINADPAGDITGDANGDGTRDSSQDEFVEIVNSSGNALDISGWTVSDGFGVRHTFPANTIVPDQCSIVVFGGGTPTGSFGGAVVQTASTGSVGLNNSGDTVTLNDGAIDQATANYGSEGGANQSLTRDPDITGATFVQHTGATGSGGALFSPGTQIDGTSFAGCAQPVEQLLLSEIVVTPTDGEFVEIYNPNGSALDLSNVYLTDATYAGGSVYYYQIVSGGGGGGSFGDFNARFPDGASIAAGEYQTIALAGSDGFFATYGVNPTYELYEDGLSADAIPDMREAVAGSINNQGGFSNSGEVVILYQWDGIDTIVTDLDYVVWGDKAEAVDKTGVSTYQSDTAIANQDVVDAGGHASGSSWQRDDLSEGSEVNTNGNGAGGHDETSENLSITWCTSSSTTPNAASVCPSGVVITDAKIHEVQGSGLNVTAPNTVVRVEAVVVGDYQEGDQLRGFFIQEEDVDVDADPMTSEGIFVYCGGCSVAVVEGDLVEVVGTQEDFFGMSQLDVPQAGVDGNVTVVSSGNMGLVSPALIDLPAAASTTAEGTFEQYEGMLIQVVDELTVTEYYQLARFGQIVLSEGGKLRQYTSENLPSAAGYAAHLNDIAARRIILDDLNNSQNSTDPVYHPQPNGFSTTDYIRGGDTVSNLTGVLHWSYAGSGGTDAWRVRPQISNPITFNSSNPRPAAPDSVGGNIQVATLNVLNYFTTIDDGVNTCGPAAIGCRGANSAAELARQTDKLVAALLGIDADIVGLVEIENNETASLQAVVDALNVASTDTYAYINTGFIGTDAIKVGIIYKSDVVSPSGIFAVLDTSDFTDPNNIGSPKNRPALAQTFEVTNVGNDSFGAKFTIVVNHLKSKGSSCGVGDDDTTTGQANCNLTRTLAAQKLVDWLATDPTGSNDPDMLVLGDLNSYAMEDPIQAIQAGPDDLAGTADDYTNLVNLYGGSSAYSFVFSGQWGYLDHALSNGSLTAQVTGVTEWRINADEVNLLDYNDAIQDPGEASYEVKPSVNPLYAPDAYRVADHDPIIIGLNPSPYILNEEGCIVIALEGSPFEGPATVVTAKHGRFNALSWKHRQGLPIDTCFEIHGTNGNDRIIGAYENDTIYGYDGNDKLYGYKGNDTLFGGNGNDKLSGYKGDDTLFGGNDNDRLDGGYGDFDRLYGEDGDDRLIDRDGVAAAHGGNGNDKLYITLHRKWLSIDGQRSFDGLLSGGYGDDYVRLTIQSRYDYFVNITGDERDDPPSPDEGDNDVLKLHAHMTPDSIIIKFEKTKIR